VTVFGLFELPPIWPKNRAFSERLFFIHSVIGIALTLSGGRAHRRGALPPFRAKDHVLLRMLTSLKAEAERPMPAQSAAVQPVSLTSVNAGARGELLRRSNSFTASQKM
jgi:hypothetical protein